MDLANDGMIGVLRQKCVSHIRPVRSLDLLEAVAEDAVESSNGKTFGEGMPPGCCHRAAIRRPSALREQVSSRVCGGAPFRDAGPFRECDGITRSVQQLDGCGGIRAALRRVEYPKPDMRAWIAAALRRRSGFP